MPLEDSFYVVDIGVLVSQVYQWRRVFPRVEPFYAVKCNPDPLIVKTLATLGCNFDCASRNEIRLVMEATKDMPTKPDIIYANPCKSRLGLLEAVCKGVKMVTFDNEMEVQKCASISKNIQLVLRIITDDRGSQCRLSSKFGAPRHKWRLLLAAAQKHGLQVVGVSFHVGSGCRDASRYEAALKDAREIFDLAGEYGMNMQVLDIGGGFPGETHRDGHFMYFTEIAEQVAPLIDEMFPPSVRIIGEPGRYFVAACATLCCSVIAARTNEMNSSFEPEAIDDKEAAENLPPLQDDYSYYINDGVYGAFNNIMFDHATVRPRILGPGEKIVATEEDVFGPTCDSIDVIARSVLLPKLKVGDYMYFQNMGAYTMAAASSFNGFTPSEKFYVCSV
ncbi:ornithine decarboxylase 2, partial [Phaeodactylum tricornutum CCAP 1055/1]